MGEKVVKNVKFDLPKQVLKLLKETPSSTECFTTHRYTQTFTVCMHSTL